MAGPPDNHAPVADGPNAGDGSSTAPAAERLSSIPPSPRAAPHTSTYTGPDETTEITHLYLTFATPLPTSNTTIQHPLKPPTLSPPPTPPDLAPYTDPLTWSPSRKYFILLLSCIATWLTAYTAGSYSPPQHLIQASLHGNPSIEAVLAGITTFCLGFALAPMVLAPLSEMNGRYPVFVVAGVVYVVFQAVCGVVDSLAGMLVARFLVGVGGSVFSTMVGGVIADMWDAKGRNMPMALFSGAVLAGTGAGPLVGAVMTQRMEEGGRWKWIFWHQVLMGGVLMVAFVACFRESRGSVLLSRKARALNKWYEKLEEEGYFGVWDAEVSGSVSLRGVSLDDDGDEEKNITTEGRHAAAGLKRIRWRVKEDEERASLGKMIATSVSRPFHLLFTEPVVFFFSMWVAFAWGILYLTFGSIPLVFQDVYGWSLEQAGYIFASTIIGAVLATAIGIWQEQILLHPKWASPPLEAMFDSGNTSEDSNTKMLPSPPAHSDRFWGFLRQHFPASSPDSRLYFTCLTSTLLPIGLFVFGFTARADTHWIAPAIGVVLATMGILLIYLAVFNYFADTYHKYASSALAAQSFCRNILGGAFPLVTGPLFRNLGDARAGGLLGGIATALTVVPWVLVFFGRMIRARSPFASQLEGI
ncbi:major facilitator superfamily domain-containing protein [Achaetomium macrosporum]|uniref:Major facilitator superfamily domain-containing protein n=1 Tax=Achaetomium macrosporum TaxID=79813 RepID=A0AAN7C957_9PEZI|nr:major facilitator superfamily domain-containing protein [Achaetomium macrosporum]